MSLGRMVDFLEDDETTFNIARAKMQDDLGAVRVMQNSDSNKLIDEAINKTTPQQTSQEQVKTTPQQTGNNFDPNEVFNIGSAKPVDALADNPFSQESLTALATELSNVPTSSDAQTLNIGVIDGSETNIEDSYSTNIDESQTLVVQGQDGLGFGINEKPQEPNLNPLGFTINEPEDVIATKGVSVEQVSQIELQNKEISEQQIHEEMSKIATKLDSAVVAESFNPNAVVRTETEADDFKLEIEPVEPQQSITVEPIDKSQFVQQMEVSVAEGEEVIIEVLDTDPQQSGEYDYLSQMEKTVGPIGNTPKSSDDYYNNLAPNTQEPESQYQNSGTPTDENSGGSGRKQTPNDSQQRMQQKPVSPSSQTSDGFIKTYETDKGEKYRINFSEVGEKPKTKNENILDIERDINNGLGQITSEVLVKGAKIMPFGTAGQTRVVWTFITSDFKELESTQFTLKDNITMEELEGFFDNVVKVTGDVELYRGKKQLKTTLITQASLVQRSDFDMPSGLKTPHELEIDQYKDWYRQFVSEITSPWQKLLLKRVLVDTGLLTRSLIATAGSKVHDSAIGGHFKHTMKVVMNVRMLIRNYPHLSKDVTLTSSILHDIGKLFELSGNDYTLEGELFGHIVIGHSIVKDAINQLKAEGVEVVENESLNILHCIVSHHGNLEWGSPVKPKTGEAMLLHLADMVDARLTHIDEQLGDKNKAYSKTFRHNVFDL